MVTADVGRLGIIRRAREAITPTVVRYQELRAGIISHLTDAQRNVSILHQLRDSLERKRDDHSQTAFSIQDATSSIAALDAFEMMENQIGGYRFIPVPPLGQLSLGGISVSVNLDAIFLREKPSGVQFGGVLIKMTKAEEETEKAASKRRDMGAYAATLAMMQARSLSRLEGTVHHDLCMSMDVQCKEVHTASRNHATRSNQLEAACRFIAALWETA